MSNSPLMDYMKSKGVPATRQNYLSINHMGKPPAQLSPELEAEMPQELQLPQSEETEMPKAPVQKGTKAGASASFPGPVLPNPKNIRPRLDTEIPAGTPNKFVKMDNLNHFEGDHGMDTSNPPTSDLVPAEDRPDTSDVQVPMRPVKSPTIREQ